MKLNIKLNSIAKVKSFVSEIRKHDGDFYIHSGRYVVDAKSIMGIFSLDLLQDLMFECEEENDEIFAIVKEYAVEEIYE